MADARAWRRLKAIEEDAAAGEMHTHEDLDVLLSEWDITQSLPGDGFGFTRRCHPLAQTYPFHYPKGKELVGDFVIEICARIRRLHERLNQ